MKKLLCVVLFCVFPVLGFAKEQKLTELDKTKLALVRSESEALAYQLQTLEAQAKILQLLMQGKQAEANTVVEKIRTDHKIDKDTPFDWQTLEFAKPADEKKSEDKK